SRAPWGPAAGPRASSPVPAPGGSRRRPPTSGPAPRPRRGWGRQGRHRARAARRSQGTTESPPRSGVTATVQWRRATGRSVGPVSPPPDRMSSRTAAAPRDEAAGGGRATGAGPTWDRAGGTARSARRRGARRLWHDAGHTSDDAGGSDEEVHFRGRTRDRLRDRLADGSRTVRVPRAHGAPSRRGPRGPAPRRAGEGDRLAG